MRFSLVTKALLPLSLAAASATAGGVDPNFAYDFLNKGGIAYCPGVSLRVLSVGAVGGTDPGGGQQMYTQDFYNQDHSHTICFPPRHMDDVERCHTTNSVPHRDIRADVEGQLRGFDLSKQSFGASLGQLVPDEAALAEQVPVQNGKVEVCVSKLDLVNVSQDLGARTTTIKFEYGFKYSVALDTDNGRQTFLVQEVAGVKTVKSGFANVYASYNPQALPFLANSWSDLQQDIAGSLAAVPNAEADAGLAKVKSYLGEYLGPNGQE
jgi:hypothetical protein